jgi:hypothetical protein
MISEDKIAERKTFEAKFRWLFIGENPIKTHVKILTINLDIGSGTKKFFGKSTAVISWCIHYCISIHFKPNCISQCFVRSTLAALFGNSLLPGLIFSKFQTKMHFRPIHHFLFHLTFTFDHATQWYDQSKIIPKSYLQEYNYHDNSLISHNT